jgi:hypothetical protein
MPSCSSLGVSLLPSCLWPFSFVLLKGTEGACPARRELALSALPPHALLQSKPERAEAVWIRFAVKLAPVAAVYWRSPWANGGDK